MLLFETWFQALFSAIVGSNGAASSRQPKPRRRRTRVPAFARTKRRARYVRIAGTGASSRKGDGRLVGGGRGAVLLGAQAGALAAAREAHAEQAHGEQA